MDASDDCFLIRTPPGHYVKSHRSLSEILNNSAPLNIL